MKLPNRFGFGEERGLARKGRPTTIRDVARAAGLSATTVSRALNGHGDVATGTRELVERVARVLDYHPNSLARSLQTSRADAIGLIIPHVLHRTFDAFWLDFIAGVEATCAPRGIALMIAATDHEVTHEFRRLARGQRVDGLLLCDVRTNDARVAYLASQGLPFVCFGRTIDQNGYPYIDVDGAAGVSAAIEYLIGLGHTRIAYVGVDPGFGFSYHRFRGYHQALTRAGVPFDPDLVREGLTERNAVDELKRLLSMPEPPTAIFAAADFLGAAAVKACQTLKIQIPDDLSICVFDDSPLIAHIEPPLSVVSQSNRRLGEESARLLLDRIDNPTGPLVQRLMVPALVTRASTTRPRPTDRDLAAV